LAFAELAAEPLKHPRLFLAQADLALGSRGQQAMALPHPADAAGRDLDALQLQFLLDPHRAVAGIHQRMVKHGLFDLRRDLARVRSAPGPSVANCQVITISGQHF
jgi:hypothetical protein